jgi:DNA polymerase-3 subunit epsilon
MKRDFSNFDQQSSTGMEFAIVDIETTGGYASGSGITEIAILIHNGVSVTERFETLLNPRQSVPLSIQLLTGINDDMLENSPAFGDVAAHIFQLLEGRIFVAHSVNFDYSFLKHHLEAEGYVLQVPKLCTVRLSRKIRPGLPSYSLGKLCDALDIPLSNRHRAGGDADATAILFSRLFAWDTEGHIAAMLKINSKEQALPPNLPREDFDNLPQCPGVYYFRDKAEKVIYVGKARNIRKRVSSHFTGHNPNPQRQNFLRNIHSIRFERCGTELFALLLEAVEIKRLWPAFNRAQKHHEPKFGLYLYEDLNGYLRLVVGKHNKYQPGLHTFSKQEDARNLLHKLVREFGLCPELCMLDSCTGDCHTTVAGSAVCLAREDRKAYNDLVQSALAQLEQKLPSFALLDEGRHGEEKSCIWVERGSFYGMGYIDSHTDLNTVQDIRACMKPYIGNAYMMQLINSYAAQYPQKVLSLAESATALPGDGPGDWL